MDSKTDELLLCLCIRVSSSMLAFDITEEFPFLKRDDLLDRSISIQTMVSFAAIPKVSLESLKN